MMAKPSQPVPVNVKDTVSSLRAAVQVLRGVYMIDRAVSQRVEHDIRSTPMSVKLTWYEVSS